MGVMATLEVLTLSVHVQNIRVVAAHTLMQPSLLNSDPRQGLLLQQSKNSPGPLNPSGNTEVRNTIGTGSEI
jgi:hypothetical protein